MSVCLVRVAGPEGDGDGQDKWFGDPSDPGVQVTLPVVLGRGSLLKCGEKKVSRRHAYLDWEDKGVLLTAVHQSPTYVVVGSGALQEVMEGTSVLLSHGDKFGFLKDKFWYMISLPSSLISEEKEEAPSFGRGEEEETKEGERIGEERNEDKEKQGEVRNEEKKQQTNETSKEVKGESTENRKWAKGSHEAVNGDTPQRITTTSTTTSERTDTHESREGEHKVVKTEHDPQHQQGAEGAEGDTEQHKDSSPSTSTAPSITRPSGAPSPRKVTGEEVLSAIGTRERNLPLWLQHPSSGTSTASTTPAPAKPRSRRGNSRARNTSSRTQANRPTTPDPPQGNGVTFPGVSETDGDLFSLNTVNKRRQQRESPQRPQNSTRKAQKSPHRQKNQQSSPVKRGGGGGGGIHHQMSDDSDGEDGAAPSTTTTTTTTTTTAASPPSSPHTPSKPTCATPRQVGKHQAQDKDEEEEEVGGGSNDTPQGASSHAPPPIAPTASSRPPRPSCQYGATCYRKNPVHKQQEAHPGDPDYHSPGDGDSDGDGDDRPECEYGVDCYRRNPQHRKDFKHSRIPQPQRRAKRKARQQKGRQATGAEGSDDDEYDYDDPFLNDGSSDDYAPTDDSSDSGLEPSQDGVEEEDTKRMLKEGKKFVKKRK